MWPEVWTKIGKVVQNREKQKWKKEKPKLENVRRLREIYFVHPDDQDFKETLKKRGDNWKDLWQRPCRAKGKLKLAPRRWLQSREIASQKIPQTICGCKVESHESQGTEWNLLYLQNTDDPLQSDSQIYSCATSDENSGYERCSGQGMEKARDNPIMETGECQEQERGYSQSTKRHKESRLCYIDGQMPS